MSMKEQSRFKFNRQIYFILAFVLLMALVIQTTRSQSFLNYGGELNSSVSPSSKGEVNAISKEEIGLLNEEKLLVLYNPNDMFSVKLKDNTEQMLIYMKKKHDVVDFKQYAGSGEGYDSVIIAFNELAKLPSNSWLDGFVEQGGRMLFTTMPVVDGSFYRIYRKLGINEAGDYGLTKGLVLKSNVLINYKNEEFPASIIENTSLEVQLSKESQVHAVADNGQPLLWEVAYGKGSFVVFNGTMFQEKTSRGFLTGAISMLKDDNIYPVMNMKLMYIDDFPAPLPLGFNEDIYRKYKRSLTRFFKEIWWPDMLRVGTRFGLKYTGMVIQSYNDKVEPPFDVQSESDNLNLVTFGRELLKRGGEIGIHGYNHQSLTDDWKAKKEFGYNSWTSNAHMEESIRTVLKFVRSSIPNYSLHNYVPPSNTLSEEGREALKASWPELKSISSVYTGDSQGITYEQEFEVAQDGIVELPRITSGFMKAEFNVWAMANAASSIGVFSHFIHPDDILDPERSFPYTWDELYDMFTEFMGIAEDKYGWLRNMTATEASVEVGRYALSEPHFEYGQNQIKGFINHYTGGKLYYILRTDKKITREQNCRIKLIDDETYLIEVENEHFLIGLGG